MGPPASWTEQTFQKAAQHLQRGQLAQAEALYRQILAREPNHAGALHHLGIVASQSGRNDIAIELIRQSLVLSPNDADATNNLANVFRLMQQWDSAIAEYRKAIALKDNFFDAWNNLGSTLRLVGRAAESIIALREAIRIRPESADAHWNLSLSLLLNGDLQAGWAEHEWRWQANDFPSPRRNFSQPQWNGEDFTGRTLLLHFEQGIGDSIQFIRYAPMARARGSRVIFLCQPELARLLRSNSAICDIVSADDPLPDFDLHCPLLTLPHIFKTDINSIPATIPYLEADPELVSHWQSKLERFKSPRIAVTWAGNPKFKNDNLRSLSLDRLAPLASVKGAQFFSLQKGAAAGQLNQPPPGMNLVDLGHELNDFADTAAVLSQMDLVISSDTSMPHLSGAMGKPTWMMMQYSPDWRWMREREDTPWYPTMRLFRQKSMGDWAGVIERVAAALSDLQNLSIQRRGL